MKPRKIRPPVSRRKKNKHKPAQGTRRRNDAFLEFIRATGPSKVYTDPWELYCEIHGLKYTPPRRKG